MSLHENVSGLMISSMFWQESRFFYRVWRHGWCYLATDKMKVSSRLFLVVIVTGIELLLQRNIFALSCIWRYSFSKNYTISTSTLIIYGWEILSPNVDVEIINQHCLDLRWWEKCFDVGEWTTPSLSPKTNTFKYSFWVTKTWSW